MPQIKGKREVNRVKVKKVYKYFLDPVIPTTYVYGSFGLYENCVQGHKNLLKKWLLVTLRLRFDNGEQGIPWQKNKTAKPILINLIFFNCIFADVHQFFATMIEIAQGEKNVRLIWVNLYKIVFTLLWHRI